MSSIDDWNEGWVEGWVEGYKSALQDAINAVNKFVNNPEDDWDKAIDNLFIKKIIEAIKSPCYHTKYEGCPPCIHDNAIFRAQSTELFEGSE